MTGNVEVSVLSRLRGMMDVPGVRDALAKMEAEGKPNPFAPAELDGAVVEATGDPSVLVLRLRDPGAARDFMLAHGMKLALEAKEHRLVVALPEADRPTGNRKKRRMKAAAKRTGKMNPRDRRF